MGFVASRLLYVVVERGIPDLLVDGPRSSDELAGETGLHEPSLYRVLRALAAVGVFAQDGRRFSLTPLGEALRSGHPSAARELVLSGAAQWSWQAWLEFPRVVETGRTAMELTFGESMFEFLQARPEESALFNRTMTAVSAPEPPAVVAAYDFSGRRCVVDVGGGIGRLLTTILKATPQLRGVLFDLPRVADEARAALAEAGVADRCDVVPGDFFVSVPEGGDVYLLSHVIHDWNDEGCLAILANCRRAMVPEPDSRLLIVEVVLPSDDEPHPGKFLDINMLVYTGGQERTAAEYDDLLGRAGFRLERVLPTASMTNVIEAVLQRDSYPRRRKGSSTSRA